MGLFDSVKKMVEHPMDVFNPVALGGDILGTLQGGWEDFTGQTNVNQTNAMQMELADKQMAFQERMSSTAHQREVEDLRKAGLNPLLSANSGASSPGGAMANLTANPSGVRDALSRIVDYGNSLRRTSADVANTTASTIKTMNDAEVSKRTADLVKAQTLSTGASARSIEASLPEKELKGSMWKKIKEIIQSDVEGYRDLKKYILNQYEGSQSVPFKLDMNDLPLNQ